MRLRREPRDRPRHARRRPAWPRSMAGRARWPADARAPRGGGCPYRAAGGGRVRGGDTRQRPRVEDDGEWRDGCRTEAGWGKGDDCVGGRRRERGDGRHAPEAGGAPSFLG